MASSTEIRVNGIGAPGATFVTGDPKAVACNIGLLVGAAQEIAAQLAELNECLRRIAPAAHVNVDVAQ